MVADIIIINLTVLSITLSSVRQGKLVTDLVLLNYR